jgi:hypothetical protein
MAGLENFRSVMSSGELFEEPNVVILPDLPDGATDCEVNGQYLTRAEVYRRNAHGFRRLAVWHRDRAQQERDLTPPHVTIFTVSTADHAKSRPVTHLLVTYQKCDSRRIAITYVPPDWASEAGLSRKKEKFTPSDSLTVLAPQLR